MHVCPFTERANADEAAWRREQALDKLRLAYHEAAHAIGLRLAGRLRRRADCREPIDGACQQPSLRGISPSAYLTALLLGEACERGALMTRAATEGSRAQRAGTEYGNHDCGEWTTALTIVRSHPWRRLTLKATLG